MKKLPQWIIVRTNKGRELHGLIASELETLPEETGGNCKKAVIRAARNIVDQMKPDKTSERKTGRKLPLWAGRTLAAVMKRIGPRGLEYARYGVDMHMIRDYYYVTFYYPELKETLVPRHVYRILEEYEFKP